MGKEFEVKFLDIHKNKVKKFTIAKFFYVTPVKKFTIAKFFYVTPVKKFTIAKFFYKIQNQFQYYGILYNSNIQ
jgi:hypothetical protein